VSDRTSCSELVELHAGREGLGEVDRSSIAESCFTEQFCVSVWSLTSISRFGADPLVEKLIA
jgi:hypothetical protein